MMYLLIDKSNEFRSRKIYGFHTDLIILKKLRRSIKKHYYEAIS